MFCYSILKMSWPAMFYVVANFNCINSLYLLYIMQPEILTLTLGFVMFLSQTVSVIFQRAASGVGIAPSSSILVRVIYTLLYISQGKNCWQWHQIPALWNLIIWPNITLFDFQIETGSKVELPFWLAHELQLRQAVSVNVPPCFNQK